MREVSKILLISQMQGISHRDTREGKLLAQGHTASYWATWKQLHIERDLNYLSPEIIAVSWYLRHPAVTLQSQRWSCQLPWGRESQPKPRSQEGAQREIDKETEPLLCSYAGLEDLPVWPRSATWGSQSTSGRSLWLLKSERILEAEWLCSP